VYGEYWAHPQLERSFWSSSDVSDTAFENDSDADMYKNARYALWWGDTLARVSLVSEWETRVKLHARCVKNTTAAPKISYGIELPCNSLTTDTILDRCRNSKEDHCEYGTLTDERDGQVYKTVKIGDQWWMAENLKFRYMQKTKNLDSSSFCFNDSLEYCEKYGRLYLWSAAMDSASLYSQQGKGCGYALLCSRAPPVRGVCPEGWHIPHYDEWDIVDSVTFLKEFDDPFGLNVVPADMWNDSTWQEKSGNGIAAFWSSWQIQSDRYNAWTVYMTDTVSRLDSRRTDKPAYVRCIKDWTWPIDQ
jgi:hypothetical protein